MHILQVMKSIGAVNNSVPLDKHDLSLKHFRNEVVMKQKLCNNAFVQGLSQNATSWRCPRIPAIPFLPVCVSLVKTKPILLLSWGKKKKKKVWCWVSKKCFKELLQSGMVISLPLPPLPSASHHLTLCRQPWLMSWASTLLIPFFFNPA